jgi:K+-sensing histidine kinase KdpD
VADTSPDDLLAVIAHSLLGSMTVIVGSAEMLETHWSVLAEDVRCDLIAKIRTQSAHVSGVLGDLVRLGDPEMIEALDSLLEVRRS